MASKDKDSPSKKIDTCLKQQFSPEIVDEFLSCLTEIYKVKEWSDLYIRKAEGRELNTNLVFAYSDTLTQEEVEAMTNFLFKPALKTPNN